MLRNTYAYARPPLMQTCFELLLGSKGLVTVTGDDHKRHRRILAPAFTQKAVDQCLPSFAATADKLCSRIKLLLNPVGPDAIKDEGFAEDHDSQKHISSNVEMSSLLNNATLDAAGLAAFGYDFKALDNGNDVTDAGAEALSGKVSLVGYFLMHALPYIPFVAYLPIKTVRHHAHALRMLQKSAEDILENTASDNGEGQTNLLSLILAANQNPSKEHVRLHDNEVVGTITNFVAAAHETTATSLSWCLVHLVQHPHIQDRLRTELAATMASHDGVVSVEAVADMPYLDAFLVSFGNSNVPTSTDTDGVAERIASLLSTRALIDENGNRRRRHSIPYRCEASRRQSDRQHIHPSWSGDLHIDREFQHE